MRTSFRDCAAILILGLLVIILASIMTCTFFSIRGISPIRRDLPDSVQLPSAIDKQT
jgi:hypothetical protein